MKKKVLIVALCVAMAMTAGLAGCSGDKKADDSSATSTSEGAATTNDAAATTSEGATSQGAAQ